MKKYLVFVLFLYAALLSSCTLFSTNAKRTFAIRPAINYKSQTQNGVIMIEEKSCSSIFGSTFFYYRKNRYEFEPYKTVGWIEPPCSMIKSNIEESIEKSGLFKLAEGPGGLVPYDYKLKFTLNDLEPVFSKKRNYVLVDINFFLFDSDNRLISSYTIKNKEKLDNIKPENVVRLINKAVKSSIIKMLVWLNRSVR